MKKTSRMENETFIIEGGCLYKKKKEDLVKISNFYLSIIEDNASQQQDITQTDRQFSVIVHIGKKRIPLTLSQDVIAKNQVGKLIQRAIGSEAIIYGQPKDIWIAAQDFSTETKSKSFSTEIGFDHTGKEYKSGNILITETKIKRHSEKLVVLHEKSPARNIEFKHANTTAVNKAAKSILDDFLKLKDVSIMYPLAGHISLAPFCSEIKNITGKNKYVLHIMGPSGCGKTYTSALAMSFFGSFEDSFITWASTPNAIEAMGHDFKDTLYCIDDYKAVSVDQKQAVGVIQRYVEETGRIRLKPNLAVQDSKHIRGLILSTGEDFIENTASVTGRTIILKMDGLKNTSAGKNCWENKEQYKCFLPWLIYHVISDPRWREECKEFVEAATNRFIKFIPEISNGLRIAGNWALNAWGFEIFLRTFRNLGLLTAEQKKQMHDEYNKIVEEHLDGYASELLSQNPTEQFFNILAQKLIFGEISIKGLKIKGAKKAGLEIGRPTENNTRISLYTDRTMSTIIKHFRSLAQKVPFTQRALRDALVNEKLIIKPATKRIAKQVRGPEGKRFQCWEFKIEAFIENVFNKQPKIK